MDEHFIYIVLEIVSEIPKGSVATYKQIAELAGMVIALFIMCGRTTHDVIRILKATLESDSIFGHSVYYVGSKVLSWSVTKICSRIGFSNGYHI